MLLEREKENKERIIEQLTKELQDLTQQIRQEKRKIEEIEDQDDQLDEEKERLEQELDQLDEQLDAVDDEGEDDISENEDLLIQKLEAEANYYDEMIMKEEQGNVNLQKEFVRLSDQNQWMKNENIQMETKLAECNDLDKTISELQSLLTTAMDKEKNLFDENLQLLNTLKQLELEEQQHLKNKSEKEFYVNTLIDQEKLERLSRQIDYTIREFTHKLNGKQRIFDYVKWKLDEALRVTQNDVDLRKMIGIDNFKTKLDRFQLELASIITSRSSIVTQKKAVDELIFIQDIKNCNNNQLQIYQKQLLDLQGQLQQLINKDNDSTDLPKFLKSFLDFERDVETEFMKKFRSLKTSDQDYQLITLMQDEAFKDITKTEIKPKVKTMLYDIEEYPILHELHQNWVVSQVKENQHDYKQSNKDIKMFYQLQYVQGFKRTNYKQEIRQIIQSKLKKISDNINELDRVLQENSDTLDQISKEGTYLKESEFSPVKGRVSIIYGAKGDLEKEKELQVQIKEIEQQQHKFDELKLERDKLKKYLKQYQQKFDEMDLENSNMIQLEELVDEVNTDLEYKTEDLKGKVKNQLKNDIKGLQSNVEERLQKFQDKRQILSECRHGEKDKRGDILKCESISQKLGSRFEKLEKELKNQLGIHLDENSSQQLLQDQQDIYELKRQLSSFQKEIDSRKQTLQQVGTELNQIGEKIITLDNLKHIQAQLQEMDKIKRLQDGLKIISDQLASKEVHVESLIKDMVGNSMFDCEKKFKEAEQILENINKKLIDINNGINDFDLDLKKGLHLYANNEELQAEGKKFQEDNQNDRKDLKQIEDQKNLIRKTLHKIKNTLNDKDQNKKNLTAATIEEFIHEIGTCIQKGSIHLKDLDNVDQKLRKRKDDWNKLVFKGGSQEALIDDIDKQIKDLNNDYDSLEKKINDADKMIQSQQELLNNLKDNPDYELRKPYINKLIESLKKCQATRDQIKQQLNACKGQINTLKQAKEQGLRTYPLQKLQEFARVGEETQDVLAKEHKKADALIKDLLKIRQKIGDAEIYDHLRQRIENTQAIEQKVKNLDKEQAELNKILQESAKINPGGVTESLQQVNDINKAIDTIVMEKDQIMAKIHQLKNQIKQKDLNRDDPSQFIQIINGIRDLKTQLDNKDQQLINLGNQIKYLKNKHGGIDIIKKFDQYNQKAIDYAARINSIIEDNEVLKELQEEFDGYTSDNQEEDFIDRLGIETKEIEVKALQGLEHNEQLIEKIHSQQKGLSKQGQESINSQEMEKRAKIISEIEVDTYKLDTLIEELDKKVNRSKKIFSNMNAKDKLNRREQEVTELNKRLNQFDNFVNEVEIDIQQEIYQLKQQESPFDDQVLQTLEDISKEMMKVKNDYKQPQATLNSIYQQIQLLKNQQNTDQFTMLKAILKIKKQILSTLALIKQTRIYFNQLKAKFEVNKPKKQIAYKPIKGDYVDQLLADWVNNNNCPVPISRVGNGFYMFGTKKIFAKIINGKLLIRVGGGYMGIDEFMFYYGAQELNKMLAYEDFDGDEEIDFDKALDTDENKSDIIKQFQDGKAVIGSQQFKKRISPRPLGSPRAGSPNAQSQISGKRSQQQMVSPRNNPQRYVSPRNI